ncbi:MAG: 5-bromo-4-chloroindolyl phosphate hydrolysis family protein [Oscillospiraceae bacterium]|nr:5-bromo-4-chloroindolyl phosphate hydrolysis family protein [Oscillospiraceae bacterium]
MKKKIVHKSAAPLYAAAAVWVLYALLFPLHRLMHFIVVILASALVGGIAKLICKDVVEEVEVPAEPETTGNAELDKMIDACDKAIAEMKRLDDNIADEKISVQIVRLGTLTEKILGQVKADPAKLPQIRKFMNYYVPTTLKLLNAYDRMGAQGVEGENISGTMAKVEQMMGTIVIAFEKQLDSLFGSEALDISTDITVLDNMMAREGLSDDPIHRSQEAEKNDETDAGGITLEL